MFTPGARRGTRGLVRAPTDLTVLSDFFDRYGAALTTGDVTAVAGCYALPGMVVADSYSFTFTSHKGAVRRFEEIAWQEWRGDKIWRETFFYDPGQTQKSAI